MKRIAARVIQSPSAGRGTAIMPITTTTVTAMVINMAIDMATNIGTTTKSVTAIMVIDTITTDTTGTTDTGIVITAGIPATMMTSV